MLTNLLVIPAVKAAIEAFQSADSVAWKHLFAYRADLYEDGSLSDLERFTQEALGRDSFLSIDRVANNGLYIEGNFNSLQFGIFRVYLNFELNDSGKIRRLDIGRLEETDLMSRCF